jgi:hypothetical protein
VVLIAALAIVLAAAFFYGGMVYGLRYQAAWGPNMMGGFGPGGMMGGYGYNGRGGGSYGPGGMMGGYGGMMNGGGMMGGNAPGPLSGVKPLTIEQAQAAVESYLAGLHNDELELKEIMLFENNAYALVIEKTTNIGAFELLVDPVNQAVFPEYGPNMMWNLKYGMMNGSGGYGMMGPGMMGGYAYGNGAGNPAVTADMPVSAAQASESAQKYLDAYLAGTVVTEEVSPFYGYYTIDIARDGKTVGMLGVNGYTRQVFLHTWHGAYIATREF